jgi:plastocyanin
MRRLPRVVIGAMAIVALALAAWEGGALIPVPSRVAARDATPSTLASPIATPRATALPLYTPIPVSAARNVVGQAAIELTDRGFIPSRFEQAINQPITFTLVNRGTRRHNFSIDELDVDVDVEPGETTTFTIPSPRRLGAYTYYSNTPDDRALGMTGTMTIFI